MSQISIDQAIMDSLRSGLHEAIKNHLTGHGSSLAPIVAACIKEKEGDIRKMLLSAFEALTFSEDFARELKDSVSKKVARVVLDKTEGEIATVAGVLKSSPEFRARLTLLVSNLVSEYRGGRDGKQT